MSFGAQLCAKGALSPDEEAGEAVGTHHQASSCVCVRTSSIRRPSNWYCATASAPGALVAYNIFIPYAGADCGSSLPQAIQQYDLLRMPAPQVVDGIIATLGARHPTASQPVFLFAIVAFFVRLTRSAGAQLPVDAQVGNRESC